MLFCVSLFKYTRSFDVKIRVIFFDIPKGKECVKVKVNVKFILERATNVQRGSRGIALLFP